jgi:hypothetical protein
MAGTSTNAKNRAEQSRDRSKRATNSIVTGHALRTLVEAEMVGIHSAGSAAHVRRMRRETVLTGFRGDAQNTPPDFSDQFSRIAPRRALC